MNTTVLPDIKDVKDQIFHEIWQLIDHKYVLFTEKNSNWENIGIEYKKKLCEIESYDRLYKLIDQMLLELRDPHTRIVYTPHTRNLGMMPLILQNIKGEYYIASDLSNTGFLSGMRLLEINDIPVKEVEEKMRTKFAFQSKSNRITSFLKEFHEGNLGHDLKITAMTSTKQVVTNRIYFKEIDYSEFDIKTVKKMKNHFSLCQVKSYHSTGYIKILNFRNKRVVNDFKEAISKVSSADCVILDIRDNPGGLIEATKDVVSMIVKEDIFLGYQIKRKECGGYHEFQKPIEVKIKSFKLPLKFQKIIILVNEFTMSSAEFIFLRALKDSDSNIKVIGNQTCGMMNSACVYTLFDGAKVQITTAKYLDDRKHEILQAGIVPHIQIDNTKQFLTDGIDDQLNYALQLCEKDSIII